MEKVLYMVSPYIKHRRFFCNYIPVLCLRIVSHRYTIYSKHHFWHNIANSAPYHYRCYDLIIIINPPILIQALWTLPFLASNLYCFIIIPSSLTMYKNQAAFDGNGDPLEVLSVQAISQSSQFPYQSIVVESQDQNEKTYHKFYQLLTSKFYHGFLRIETPRVDGDDVVI